MTSSNIQSPAQLRDAYRIVKENIAVAAERFGRRPEHVVMVAVTKTASPDQIRQLVEMGHCDVGENRVQQLIQRAAGLEEFLARKRTLGSAVSKTLDQAPDAVRWHMVGALQRNKVKQVVPVVQLIHSVNSLRLAEELHNFGANIDRVIDILLQVDASGEPTKQGIVAPAVLHVAEQIDTMIHLRLRGLMTMAPLCEDPQRVRPVFARVAEIYHDIRSAKIGGRDFNILSMGMTNDYQVAIEAGANLVRIGRALFGNEEQG